MSILINNRPAGKTQSSNTKNKIRQYTLVPLMIIGVLKSVMETVIYGLKWIKDICNW
jgi:hypothetical protein